MDETEPATRPVIVACERSRDFGSFMVREDAWAWRGKKYSRSQVYRVSEDFLPGGGGKRRRCQVKR